MHQQLSRYWQLAAQIDSSLFTVSRGGVEFSAA